MIGIIFSLLGLVALFFVQFLSALTAF